MIDRTRRRSYLVLAAALALAAAAEAQCEIDRLSAPGANLGDGFGGYRALTIEGERLVAGAPGRDDVANNSGAAYVFERSATAWTQTAQLLLSDAGSDDQMSRIDLSGDRIAAAVVPQLVPIARNGRVYVFEKVGATWTEVVRFTQSGDFGRDHALDGDVLVVGKLDAAIVIERISGTWTQTATLTPGDAVPGDNFGTAVDVSGTRIVVSAPGHDHGLTSNGAVYVFEKQGSTWVETAELLEPVPTAGMGASVVLEGDVVMVSAPFSSEPGGTQSGTAIVFEHAAGVWTRTAILAPGIPGTNQRFAQALDVDASQRQAVFGSPAGEAWLFEDAGTGWVQTGYLVSSFTQATDAFGISVAIDGDTLLVGAPLGDAVLQDEGVVSVFDDTQGGFPSFDAQPSSLSLTSGGTQTLSLNSCIDHGGDLHLVVGTFAGTTPGLQVLGQHLPLNFDPWLVYTLLNPNGLFYPDSSKSLDAVGEATASFVVPAGLPLFLVGQRVDHAYAVLDAVSGSLKFISNSAGCDLVP